MKKRSSLSLLLYLAVLALLAGKVLTVQLSSTIFQTTV